MTPIQSSSHPKPSRAEGGLRGLARGLALVLACAAVLPSAHADRARVSVGATVIPVLRLTILDARTSIELSAHDTRGADVLVPNAATIEIHSNQDRYAVHFEIIDADVSAVEVDGLQVPVLVGPAGRTVFVSNGAERRSIKTLNYRVRYAPGVAAGTRGAPLKLFVQNI
jgi:hypothetical protein